MWRVARMLIAASLGAAVCLQQPRLQALQPTSPTNDLRAMLNQSRQLVIVTTADWNAVNGQLSSYERTALDKPWRRLTKNVPIVVGQKGLGWGRGVHGAPGALASASDPLKKEGDNKAPAGVFRLSGAFGYAAPRDIGSMRLTYVQTIPTLQCVDDPRSTRYNQTLDATTVKVDWQSAEQMRRDDVLYKWGIFVDHNPQPAVAGDGSCIFLHVWHGRDRGTAGCTAMPETAIRELLRWLDLTKQPLLVQLPKPLLHQYASAWGLPGGN